MEDILGEIGKGFLRAIGYLLADFFFWFVCYWTGWPVCKVLTLGRHPKPIRKGYFRDEEHVKVWSSLVGLTIWIFVGLYFLGVFNGV